MFILLKAELGTRPMGGPSELGECSREPEATGCRVGECDGDITGMEIKGRK